MEAADLTRSFGIGTLPTELLLLVLSHLDVTRGARPDRASEDNRQTYNSQILKTLHSLTLTCQRLAAVTTPLLYRSIINTAHNSDVPLYLLRTLERNPHLAQHIQYVEYPFLKGVLPDAFTCYSKAQLDWIQAIIARAKWTVDGMERIHDRNKHHDHFDFWRFDEHERTQMGLWYRIYSARDENHILFALMAVMMQADHLSEVAAPYTRTLVILAFRASTENTGLQKLCVFGDPCQDNHIVLQKGRSPKGAHALENFLLRYLNFHFAGLHRELEVHLEDVSLNVYDAEMAIVARDLELCTSLRSFSCRWREYKSTQTNSVSSPQDMCFPLLGQTLLLNKETLERLTIDTLDCAWPIDMEIDIPPLGSLRSFRVLKHLDVSGLVLLGDYDTATGINVALSSILPASLESLKVNIEWDDEIEEVLYAYLSECGSFQPALKSIECSWRPAPKDIAKHLIDSYKEIGVDLVLAIAPTKGIP
ncbi:hypothetical protein DE146DRAFT_761725 [Phaeosphaeria sp. MPI-PUGE-AT-0046c]|nr:hypothetical protein DE146DRAFT_761725 [Phaeosphaeria sp. MPI-PUGE-AT-0046c]